MSFLHRERQGGIPRLSDLYFASVIASLIVFYAVLLVFAGMAAMESSLEMAGKILLYGLFISIIVGLPMAMLVTGPLGTAIGFGLSRFAPETRWFGPLTGLLTGSLLLLGYAFTLSGFDHPDRSDEIVQMLAFLAIGSFGGWIAQAKVLGWPRPTPSA